MFNLGAQELLIIFIIFMVLFGGKKLPELGRSLGQGLHEFKRATEYDDADEKRPQEKKPGEPLRETLP